MQTLTDLREENLGCGHWSMYHAEKGHSRYFCGRATCFREKCRWLFWFRRVKLITALISEYSLTRFFTLTLNRDVIQGDAWGYIPQTWSKMRKRLKRLKTGIRYVSVLEAHKDTDYPHIHGFTDLWLEQGKWSQMWSECGGGCVVWIERVKQEGVGEYVSKQLQVAKYVGKQNLVEGFKRSKGSRTLWRSLHTKAKFELTKEKGWCIIREKVFDNNGDMLNYWKGKEIVAYG